MNQSQIDQKILTLLSDHQPREFYQIITCLDITPLQVAESLRSLVSQGKVIEERPGEMWQYRVEAEGKE